MYPNFLIGFKIKEKKMYFNDTYKGNVVQSRLKLKIGQKDYDGGRTKLFN